MKNKSLYKISRAALFSAVICVCAFINFPFGSVPVSMALLGVMLSGVILSPAEAFCSSLVYILIGAMGLPVFSGAGAGFGVLFGPTGGYIWSYPITAFIISLVRLFKCKNRISEYFVSLLGCIIGVLFCYICGTLQYMYICDTSFYTAMITCIIPFIFFDIIKMLIACSIGIPLKERIKR